MKTFLTGSGALAFGLILAGMFTFPVLAVGVVFGYFFIMEHIEEEN